MFYTFNMITTGWSLILMLTLLFNGATSFAKQGFNDKFMSTRQQLSYTIYQNSRDQNNMKLNTSMLWSKHLNMQQNSNNLPTVIRTSHHTIMLIDMDLWVFKDEDLHYTVSLMSYFNYDPHLVKGYEWLERLYLLVCFQNSVCNLYSTSFKNYSDVTYHQPISDIGDPTDAQFFVQEGKLFLTILFHERSFSSRFNRTNSRLRIYEWRNLFMDPHEMIPDITSTATCVTVFPHKEAIIFVLGCPGDESLKFSSQIWSRKSNGEMNLVQYLPTDEPKSISHFMERGENFIIVLENYRETSVYWWEGREFVRWLSVNGMEKYFQVAVSRNIKYTTFLTFTYRNVLRVYLMTSISLQKVFETEFASRGKTESTSILSVTFFEENDITYMLVLTESEGRVSISLHKVNITIMDTIATEVPGQSEEVQRRDKTQEALDTVYRAVTSLKYKMDNLKTLSTSVLLTNEDAFIKHSVVTEEVFIETGEIKEKIQTNRDISQFMDELNKCIEPLTQNINLIWQQLQTTQLHENRQLFFLGKVVVREAKFNSLYAHRVNSDVFEPHSLLSVMKENQRLKSMKAKKVKVDWLLVKDIYKDKKAEDFKFANSRVNVPITVAGLESRNLRTWENVTINNITAKDLASKMVIVETEEDKFNRISQIGEGNPSRRTEILKLQDNTIIQNLYVDFIDEVSIDHTLSSLFVNGVDNVIDGDLHFHAGVRTNEMASRRFIFPERQGAQYSPFHVNIPTGQAIFPRPQLNLLQPQQSFIPQFGVYRPYQPPVQQYPMSWTPLTSFPLDGRRMKRERSRKTRKLMRKTKVKILGHLKVARLAFRNSALLVKKHSVPTSGLRSLFWTKASPQTINGSIHFTQGITIGSNLKSPMVNGKNISHYATRHSNFNSLVLEDIHVDGILDTENASLWMPENQVEGSVFKVLNVRHLRTKEINGASTANIMQTRDLQRKGVNIMVENLKISGNLEADLINNKSISHLLKSAVMIDNDFELDNVEFKTVSGDNFKVENINNQRFDSLMQFSSRESSSVHVHGNIHISRLSSVTSINDHPANFSKVVNKKIGATIYGKKRFIGQVQVSKALKVNKLNQVHFDGWLKRLLRVTGEQEVTGYYTARKVEMKSNFNVSSINGINLSTFIFTDQPEIRIPSNIRFNTVTVNGNLSSTSLHGSCYLPKVKEEIVFERSSKWSRVEVVGDIEWPKAGGGRLQRLFDSAVTSSSNQTISGDLTALNMSAQNIQVKSLNNKNMSFIFQDTLSRAKENQVISGKKTFTNVLNCKNIEIKGDAQLKFVEDIDVKDIDEKLVRRSGDGQELVSGHKTFLNGFKAFSLECPEGINGVKSENIISRNFKGEAPPLSVQSLKVKNSLFVETINDLNLKDFLKDCIYLNHSDIQRIVGQLHVKGNVYLQGNVTTPSINNISTNDVVFVNNKKKPIWINGCKRFTSDIKIQTDPTVNVLNERNVRDTYQANVKIDQNVTINGSVIFESQLDVDTIFAHEYFVGPRQLTHLNKTLNP